MKHLITKAALHRLLLKGVLLPHVDVEVALPSQQGAADLALVLGSGFGVLLHDVHFEAAVLGETGVAFWAFVGLFAGVGEFVAFEVEAVGEAFAAVVAFEGAFAGVGAEVAAEFGDFDRGVGEGSFECFLDYLKVKILFQPSYKITADLEELF